MSEPRRLGRYELLEQLGEGGMGAVWLARLSGTGGFEKLCIVKTVLPTIAKEKQFVSRFLHEGRVLTQLQHGNIAQIYDMSEEAGTLFLALEYVAGVDLSRLQSDLAEQRLAMPVTMAAFLMQQAAEGLAFAHRKATPDGAPLHIVHRDVSPQNIMVSYEGEVKVIDFGIAKSEARSHATATQMVMGKLGYMAPEQALAQGVDHRADQYALAVVLWELLANAPYVPRGTMTEMLMAMAQPKTHPLAPLRPEVPASLEQVVLKALAVNPADRFATTDDFARALLEQLVTLGGMPSRVQLGEFVKAHCSNDFQAQRALLTRAATIRFAAPQPTTQPLTADEAASDKTFSRAATPAPALATPTTAPLAPSAQAPVPLREPVITNRGPTAPTPAPPPKPVGTPFPDPLAGPPMSTAELKAAAMPKSQAPLFIALAVVALLGVGAVGAGAYWFTQRGAESPRPATGTSPGTTVAAGSAKPRGTPTPTGAPAPATAAAANPAGTAPPSGTPPPGAAENPPGAVPPEGAPPPSGPVAAANPAGTAPPSGAPPPPGGAENPPGTVPPSGATPPGTVAVADPNAAPPSGTPPTEATPPPPPTTVETGSPAPTGHAGAQPAPGQPFPAGPGTVEPHAAPPPPKPAAHGPLTGLARFQRGAVPNVMLTNSSDVTWTNCTVYLSGARKGALRVLNPSFSRELPLKDFVVDRAAPSLSGQVKVVCSQGNGLLKSNE